MLPSFLSYIVQEHGLTFEDAATDALAFLLQNSYPARAALREFINVSESDLLPENFSVETRHTTDTLCRPDMVLRDNIGMPCVIIEAKFSAGLTDKQPVEYLRFLDSERKGERSTLLLFLVPETKLDHYRRKVADRCKETQVSWVDCDGPRLKSLIGVATWTKLLGVIKSSEAGNLDRLIFVDDLLRMCNVAEPDKYKPMSPDELAQIGVANGAIATRMRNFMDLASEVAKRTFTTSQRMSSKFNWAWGPTWAGTYGIISGFEAWIGFDASAWSDWGRSPLWLELVEKHKFGKIEAQLLSLGRNSGYFVHPNGVPLCVPILLGTGTREEVLGSCCAQLEVIKNSLAGVTSPVVGPS